MTIVRDQRGSSQHRSLPSHALRGLIIGWLSLCAITIGWAGDHHDHGPAGCPSCGTASVASGFSSAAIGSSSIVCTVFPVYVLARELASGSGRPVHLLLPANLGCPHHYTLTPGDFDRLGHAGFIAANGLGFEPFLDRVTQNMGGVPRIDCASGLPTIPSIEDPGSPNAHVFTIPSGLQAMAERLEAALGAQDPANASLFTAHRQRLTQMLTKKASELQTLAGKLASVPVVLTHDSLDYLARALQLKVVAHLATQEGGEVSAGELATIVDLIKRDKPVAILIEGSEVPPLAQALIRETGIRPLHLEMMTSGPEQPAADFIERHFAELLERCAGMAAPK